MQSIFPVFAGLGSESIFSDETTSRAEQDSLIPECTVLLQSCHRIFRAQISAAIERDILDSDVINLDDFTEPVTLFRPPSKYHHNVLVQQTALYIQQIMRYTACLHELGSIAGLAGFCAGLLPAAAVATSGLSVVTLISRSCDFFLVSLWVGIRSEKYRRDHFTKTADNPNSTAIPCSYVVDGLSKNAVTELINEAKMVRAGDLLVLLNLKRQE